MTEPLLEWNEEERQALGAYRQALSPTGAQVKAALGGVSASLGLSVLDGAAAATATSQAPLSAVGPSAGAAKGSAVVLDFASRAALVKASLGAIVLGGAVAAYGLLEPLAPNPDVPSVPVAALSAPVPARQREAPPPALQEPPQVDVSRLEELPEWPGEEPGQGVAAPRGHAPRSPSASPRPVYEELGAVRRAQAALGAGQPEQALELMERLGQASAGGSLLVERELTRLLALCALGRRAEAQAAAARVEQLPGGAAYRTRIAGSCVGQSPWADEPIEGAH